MDLNVDGRVERTTRTLPEGSRRQLRRLIADARFFSLPEGFGAVVVDGDMRKVTIALGDESHTVRLPALVDDPSYDSYLTDTERGYL